MKADDSWLLLEAYIFLQYTPPTPPPPNDPKIHFFFFFFFPNLSQILRGQITRHFDAKCQISKPYVAPFVFRD